jgi:hypothetical protein
MTHTAARLAALATAFALGLLATIPAEAAFAKTYVSSTGTDGNDCSTIAAACHTFQRAHDQTSASGQIACVDSVDATGATITKSITIDCAGTSSTSSNFVVNAPGIIVVIRNLTIAITGGSGIFFSSGAALIVEDCGLRDYTGWGILFRPSGAARLLVSNTRFTNNGSGASGAGVGVQPMAGGSADVVLDRVRVESNTTGVFVNTSPGTNAVQFAMRDSTVASSIFTGLYVRSDGPTITAVIENSAISNSGGAGLLAQGPQSFVFVNSSTITGNDIGWTFAGGGNLVTYGNNSVHLNRTSNGAPSASIGLQ